MNLILTIEANADGPIKVEARDLEGGRSFLVAKSDVVDPQRLLNLAAAIDQTIETDRNGMEQKVRDEFEVLAAEARTRVEAELELVSSRSSFAKALAVALGSAA